jgi:hypothetical protein
MNVVKARSFFSLILTFCLICFAPLVQEAAAKALTMNGTLFKERCLRVNHSKNPIVKPPPEQLNTRSKVTSSFIYLHIQPHTHTTH